MCAVFLYCVECGECKQLEEDLTSSKAEILKLSSQLSSNQDKLMLYEHQLQDVTSKFTEEIKIKDEKLTRQNADLEAKSNTVASLTQQLYNTRLRLRNEMETNARIASGAVCKCPHCHLHVQVHGNHHVGNSDEHFHSQLHLPKDTNVSDVSIESEPTKTVRSSQIERRRKRTVSSPVPDSVSSIVDQAGLESETSTGSRRLPTPPILPRPPSNSSVRRASIPVRRQLPFTSSLTKEQTTSMTSLPGGYQDSSVEQRTLDPVRVYKCGTVPPDIRHLLRSREGDVRIVSKPAPPVLPPIQSYDGTEWMSNTNIQHSEDSQSSTGLEYASCSELPTRIPPRRHRHFILAQAQGLSSAPSTMRVLRYNPHGLESGREDMEGMREEERELIGEESAAEGTLLVRETVNRKDHAWQELHQHGTK